MLLDDVPDAKLPTPASRLATRVRFSVLFTPAPAPVAAPAAAATRAADAAVGAVSVDPGRVRIAAVAVTVTVLTFSASPATAAARTARRTSPALALAAAAVDRASTFARFNADRASWSLPDTDRVPTRPVVVRVVVAVLFVPFEPVALAEPDGVRERAVNLLVGLVCDAILELARCVPVADEAVRVVVAVVTAAADAGLWEVPVVAVVFASARTGCAPSTSSSDRTVASATAGGLSIRGLVMALSSRFTSRS